MSSKRWKYEGRDTRRKYEGRDTKSFYLLALLVISDSHSVYQKVPFTHKHIATYSVPRHIKKTFVVADTEIGQDLVDSHR